MEPELTRELILGVEHSFLPEFVAGMKLTWRSRTRFGDCRPLFRSNATGNVRTIPAVEHIPDRGLSRLLPDGSSCGVQTWAANPVKWSNTGGELLTDGDREVDYLGASTRRGNSVEGKVLLSDTCGELPEA